MNNKTPFTLRAYRTATSRLAPLIRAYLKLRLWRGKEDASRFNERLGYPSIIRPEGTLIWTHAASVGEMMSCLHLLRAIRTQRPDVTILLTTGTVTSARMAEEKLPTGVLHQFVPVDMPECVDRFFAHWQPSLALWVESELWPNQLLALRARDIPAILINGRISERSARAWKKRPTSFAALMQSFTSIFAGSLGDKARLETLGAEGVQYVGNLKYDAPALPADTAALSQLSYLLAQRPLWCAASTHQGEEESIIEAHTIIAATIPNLLTIIVPRHAVRGVEIAELIESHGLSVARRSASEGPSKSTAIYLADTMGELGNIFRLSDVVFVGGSLVARGGHNPIEPARLNCALLSGPHIHHFTDIFSHFTQGGAVEMVQDAQALAHAVTTLMLDDALRAQRSASASAVVSAQAGATRTILKQVLQLLPPESVLYARA